MVHWLIYLQQLKVFFQFQKLLSVFPSIPKRPLHLEEITLAISIGDLTCSAK